MTYTIRDKPGGYVCVIWNADGSVYERTDADTPADAHDVALKTAIALDTTIGFVHA